MYQMHITFFSEDELARTGLCTIACKEKSIFEAIDIAKSAGAEGIEVWGKPEHINYPVNKNELLKIKEYAQSREIHICALGSYLHAGAKIIINDIELSIENQIEIAELLNTNIIRIWAGNRNYDEYKEDEMEKIFNEIRAMGKLASKEKITLVLERHNSTITNQWDNIENILNEINSDNVFLNYQMPHPATVGEYKTKSISDYTKLLKYSKHAHLQNYTKDDEFQRAFLDAGIVDYSEIGEAGRETNYSGYFMVEFPAEVNEGLDELDALKKDIEFIKNL